jgi:hypothetical protein
MSFPLVLDLAVDGIPVAVACRVLGFSKQAFYKWKANPISDRDRVGGLLVVGLSGEIQYPAGHCHGNPDRGVPGSQLADQRVVIQKATTGEVNWAQSAAIGVTGALGGAGFAAARTTMAASSSLSRLGGYVAINAGVNGAAGAVAGGGVYLAKNGGVKNWRGLAGAMVGGGVSGAIGGLAGPAGGTLARASGYAANSPAVGIIARAPALLRMTALGSGGGVAGTAADKAISGEQLHFGDVVWSAATGGGLTHIPGGPFPSSTLSQAAWTNPSTLSGLRGGVNGRALIRSGVIGASVGGGFDSAKFLVTGD